MSSSSQNRRNPALNILTREIGEQEKLPKSELLALYRQIDAYFLSCFLILETHTTFLLAAAAEGIAVLTAKLDEGRTMHYFAPGLEKAQGLQKHSLFLQATFSYISSHIFHKVSPRERAKKFFQLSLTGSLKVSLLEDFLKQGNRLLELSEMQANARILGGVVDPLWESEREDILARLGVENEDSIPYLTTNIGIWMRSVTDIYNEICQRYSRLLIKVSKSLSEYNSTDALLEGFQDGYSGLARAVRDHRPQYDIIGHLSRWSRQTILGTRRENSNSIRIPNGVIADWRQLQRVKASANQDLSQEELASHAGFTQARVQRTLSIVAQAHTFSLDRLVKGEEQEGSETTRFGDLVIATEDGDSEEDLLRMERLDSFLQQLPEEEHEVMCLVFGLYTLLPGFKNPRDPRSKESVALERIRQLLSQETQ